MIGGGHSSSAEGDGRFSERWPEVTNGITLFSVQQDDMEVHKLLLLHCSLRLPGTLLVRVNGWATSSSVPVSGFAFRKHNRGRAGRLHASSHLHASRDDIALRFRTSTGRSSGLMDELRACLPKVAGSNQAPHKVLFFFFFCGKFSVSSGGSALGLLFLISINRYLASLIALLFYSGTNFNFLALGTYSSVLLLAKKELTRSFSRLPRRLRTCERCPHTLVKGVHYSL